jgi:zinc D-Ala-D-Ala carboxypeptidase
MNLSANFTLKELTKSDTATRLGLDNTPDDAALENLKDSVRKGASACS